MSEFTFAISFKCDDVENQGELVEAFDGITSSSSAIEKGIDLDAIKAKILFIEKIATITGSELDDEMKKFVIDKHFHPVKITSDDGRCILYFNASSTAGFGGWPDYKHYLAMEKLFEFLGANKVEFKLLKNVEAANDNGEVVVNEIVNEVDKREVPEVVQEVAVKSERALLVRDNASITLVSDSASPGSMSKVFYLPLPDGVSTQVHLTVRPGQISDLVVLKFDDYQRIEMRPGFLTVFKPKDKTIKYKNYQLTFKCRLYLESEVSTSTYSGHLGEFYVDGKRVLTVEF